MMNKPLPKKITIGDKYGPAMKINELTEAKAYLAKCIEHSMLWGNTYDEAVAIEKSNIGYYAGYYSIETQKRVEELFNAAHPIFGSVL